MNLATHAGLIAGTSVLTIASTGTAGDLDSVIDGIINDSATISGDDSFSMSGMFQYGFVYDMGDPGGDENDFTHDRGEMRLGFSGEAAGFEWHFDYNLSQSAYGVANGFGDNNLNSYGVSYEMDNGLKIGFGRGLAIFSREGYIDTADQLGILPTVSALTTGIYTNAISACYEADQFRGCFQLHDSAPALGGNFTDDTGEAVQAMTARGEFLVMGNWDAMSSFSSSAGSESTMVIGLGWGDEDSFDGMTYDLSYYMDAMCISVAMYDVFDGTYEATTVNASYWLMDDGQAYVKYEDIDGVDDATFSFGWNQWMSDSVRANVTFEDSLGSGGDDYAVVGGIQFTF